MAEQDSGTAGNGSGLADTDAGAGAGNGDNTGAQFSVLTQYIKDLSVENPNAPQVFQWDAQPALDVQFSLNAQKVADEMHEVAVKIDVTARSDNGVHFVVDLTYAGLFGARNVPEDALGPVLLIEAPRLLFPFARQIVCEAVTSTGFPPLLLDPIDFAAAYVAQMQAQQGALAGATPQGEA
jgi:preprotein translocase subunit SecB